MIDNHHEVEINGVKYRIMWDAGDEAYVESGESLRPPNAQLVQGEKAGYVFQMRSDTLLFSWTDWSAGEGQLKFDASNPGQAFYLNGVDPFTSPGKLSLATSLYPGLPYSPLLYAEWGGDLVGLTTGGVFYEWNGTGWYANATHDLSISVAIGSVTGDSDTIYCATGVNDSIRTKTSAGSWTILNDQIGSFADHLPVVAFGPYLYAYNMDTAEIYEISKTTANTTDAETPILDLSDQGGTERMEQGIGQLCIGDANVYALQVKGNETTIWEIVPSSAAGTGFGNRLATVEGFRGSSVWSHMGMIFVAGSGDTDGGTSMVLYFQPGGTYGTLGRMRVGIDGTPTTNPLATQGAKKMVESAFVNSGYTVDGTLDEVQLWLIDHVSGGSCVIGSSDTLTGPLTVYSMREHDGQFFFSAYGGSYKNFYTRADYYSHYGVAVSPLWDAGVAEEKILSSISVVTEPLPAYTEVEAEYSIDGGAWTSAGTHDVDGSTGAVFQVSSSSSTIKFRSIRFRLNLSGNTTVTPVVLSMEAQVKVAKGVRSYTMILDAYNDESQAANVHRRGELKIENLETAYELESVVSFKNGARSMLPNDYATHSVIVDAFRVVLDRPGNGLMAIRLVKQEE